MSEERILVVDDEKLMREYLKELLEPEYRVDTAASALDALKMLRDEVYDLVITD
ncbi:TPA: response regulator, partial [Candidatus Poribacteria bacterium]|nr:response regulator [Candidatus Poribacteria bacterium]